MLLTVFNNTVFTNGGVTALENTALATKWLYERRGLGEITAAVTFELDQIRVLLH
jgi:hypothetical protein